MLAEIGSVDRIPEFVARAKDKDDPFRLMGLATAFIKITTRARVSCRKPAMKCWASWASKMTRCLMSLWNWKNRAQ